MKRRVLFAVTISLALVAGACVSVETTEVRTTALEPRDASFPSEPRVEIVWQNTVVDIEAASQYREPPGGSDLATVSTTLALADEPDSEFDEFLDELAEDDVGVTTSGRFVHLVYQVDTEVVDDNTHEFSINVPMEFTKIQRNGDVSYVVLLPRPALEYDSEPTYDIEFQEVVGRAPADPIVSQNEDALGMRTGVHWYWRDDVDPKIGPVYIVIPSP